MNQYLDDAEPFNTASLANETVNRTDQGSEIDRGDHNRIFRVGNSPGGTVAAALGNRGPFPFRTLIVCFTIWLIATQAMIFDEIKFETRAHLLDEAAQSLRPQIVVPNGRPSNLPADEEVKRL
jgi:hypothetical protein